MSTGRAFTTDAAVRLAISTTAAFESVHVVIGEQTEGNPSLSFGNGSATMTVPAGLAEATVHIARGAGPAHATLSVVQPDGSVLARASFTLEDPDLTPRALTRLLVAPETATLTPSSLQAQLSVGGVFDDGRTYNLTTGASGTTYQAADPVIAQVSADGAVTGAAGGTTYVVAAHRDQQVTAAVDSTLTAIVTALVATRSFVTIARIGDSLPFPGVAHLSNGDNIPLEEAALATFQTSRADVATVEPDGTVVATGLGSATVTATTGALAAQVLVSVEPRTPPTVSGINLRPPTHQAAAGATRANDTGAAGRHRLPRWPHRALRFCRRHHSLRGRDDERRGRRGNHHPRRIRRSVDRHGHRHQSSVRYRALRDAGRHRCRGRW